MSMISILRNDSRTSLTDISKKTNVPISTLFDRLQGYRKHLVRRFTILPDFAALGFHTRATIILKVRREDKDALRKYLLEHMNVNSLFKINNGYDFMMDCVFRSILELEDFISSLEEQFRVKSVSMFYVLEEIAQEKFLITEDVMQAIVQQKHDTAY